MYGTGAIIAGIGIALGIDDSNGFQIITYVVFIPLIAVSTIGLLKASKTLSQVLLSLLIIVSFFPVTVLTFEPIESMWILPACGVIAGLYLIGVGVLKDKTEEAGTK